MAGSPPAREPGSPGPSSPGPGGPGARRSKSPGARRPGGPAARRPGGPGVRAPGGAPPCGGVAYRRSPLPGAFRHQRLRPWPPWGGDGSAVAS
ncbi:hypothetical protein FGK60_22325 [Streptomyces sp. DASNCL29]|nr:hypothetical protein FGK60_22325 [Streptomyces sp. DASNCL29]